MDELKALVIALLLGILGGFFVGSCAEQTAFKSKLEDGYVIKAGDKYFKTVEVKKVVTYQDIASQPATANAVYSGEK